MTAAAAVALTAALGALVATDAGISSALAWVGTGMAGLLIALAAAARSSTPVHASVALLGAMLLLRQDQRLVLAPLYGAGLLLVENFGTRSIELSVVKRVGPDVLGGGAAAALASAAGGACAAACAAIAATVATPRSVALTAAGTIAAVALFGAIVALARRGASVPSVPPSGSDRK